MRVAGRALAFAAFFALASACSDEEASNPTLSESAGAPHGGGESAVGSERGGDAANEGGSNSAAGVRETAGGVSTAGASGDLADGGDGSGPDGLAGAGGDANQAIGQLPAIDVWLASQPSFSTEFREALRAVAVKTELLLASPDD